MAETLIRWSSAVKTDIHVVRCSPRGGEPDEWVTLDYAVSRLAGYYRDDPPGWIRDTLSGGTPLQTMGFIYRIDAE